MAITLKSAQDLACRVLKMDGFDCDQHREDRDTLATFVLSLGAPTPDVDFETALESAGAGVPTLDDMLYTYGLHRIAQYDYAQKAKHAPGSDDPVYMRLCGTTDAVKDAIRGHHTTALSRAREEEQKRVTPVSPLDKCEVLAWHIVGRSWHQVWFVGNDVRMRWNDEFSQCRGDYSHYINIPTRDTDR